MCVQGVCVQVVCVHLAGLLTALLVIAACGFKLMGAVRGKINTEWTHVYVVHFNIWMCLVEE